ncbi:hypothetical protein [Nocardia sp. X0981]
MSTSRAARRGLRRTSLRFVLFGALIAAPALVVVPASAVPGAGPTTTHFAPVSDDYDKDGYDVFGRDRHGYDKDGYDVFGRDRHGYDKDGLDRYGRDRAGYDRHGYDLWGYDRRGFDREGYTRSGCRVDGNDRESADRAVCDAWRARLADQQRLPTGSAG